MPMEYAEMMAKLQASTTRPRVTVRRPPSNPGGASSEPSRADEKVAVEPEPVIAAPTTESPPLSWTQPTAAATRPSRAHRPFVPEDPSPAPPSIEPAPSNAPSLSWPAQPPQLSQTPSASPSLSWSQPASRSPPANATPAPMLSWGLPAASETSSRASRSFAPDHSNDTFRGIMSPPPTPAPLEPHVPMRNGRTYAGAPHLSQSQGPLSMPAWGQPMPSGHQSSVAPPTRQQGPSRAPHDRQLPIGWPQAASSPPPMRQAPINPPRSQPPQRPAPARQPIRQPTAPPPASVGRPPSPPAADMAALSTQPTAPAPQPAKSSAPSPAFQRFATSIFSRRAAPRDWRWNDDTLHSAVHIYAQYSMTFDHPKPPPHVLKLLDHEPTRTRLPDLAEYRRTLTEEAKAKKMNASGFWAMQYLKDALDYVYGHPVETADVETVWRHPELQPLKDFVKALAILPWLRSSLLINARELDAEVKSYARQLEREKKPEDQKLASGQHLVECIQLGQLTKKEDTRKWHDGTRALGLARLELSQYAHAS